MVDIADTVYLVIINIQIRGGVMETYVNSMINVPVITVAMMGTVWVMAMKITPSD